MFFIYVQYALLGFTGDWRLNNKVRICEIRGFKMLRSIQFLLYLMLLKAATRAQGVHVYNVFANPNSFKSKSNEYLVTL